MKFSFVLFFLVAFAAPHNEGVSLLQMKKLSPEPVVDRAQGADSTNAGLPGGPGRGTASGERAGLEPLLAEFTRSASRSDLADQIEPDGIRGLCTMGDPVAEFEGSAEDCMHMCNDVYGPDGQCDFFNYCPATKWTRYVHVDTFTRCEGGENATEVETILECEQKAEALGHIFLSYLESDGVKTCFSSATCDAPVDEGPHYARYEEIPDYTKCDRPKGTQPFYVQNKHECFGRAKSAGKPWASFFKKSSTDKRCFYTDTCVPKKATGFNWNVYKAMEGNEWKVYKYQTGLSPELTPVPDPECASYGEYIGANGERILPHYNKCRIWTGCYGYGVENPGPNGYVDVEPHGIGYHYIGGSKGLTLMMIQTPPTYFCSTYRFNVLKTRSGHPYGTAVALDEFEPETKGGHIPTNYSNPGGLQPRGNPESDDYAPDIAVGPAQAFDGVIGYPQTYGSGYPLLMDTTGEIDQYPYVDESGIGCLECPTQYGTIPAPLQWSYDEPVCLERFRFAKASAGFWNSFTGVDADPLQWTVTAQCEGVDGWVVLQRQDEDYPTPITFSTLTDWIPVQSCAVAGGPSPSPPPTAKPTIEPTPLPTFEPTPLPTPSPTHPPQDCVIGDWSEWTDCDQVAFCDFFGQPVAICMVCFAVSVPRAAGNVHFVMNQIAVDLVLRFLRESDMSATCR
jgi:hypothetical protein